MELPSFLFARTVAVLLSAQPAGGEDSACDPKGQLPLEPPPVAERFKNPCPEEWEKGLRKRPARVVELFANQPIPGSTFAENEKNNYPRAMLAFLGGRREEAPKVLQAPEAAPRQEHPHTPGIDYYCCFTLKGQMRKYFYFGQYLDADYRKRMGSGVAPAETTG